MRLQEITAVSELAERPSRLVPRTDDERALVGHLIGGLYSLRRAAELDYDDRPGQPSRAEIVNDPAGRTWNFR